MKWKVHFRTNTLLKNLIGKDLINDDSIAIIELVKNSFDAGSSSVELRFERLSGEATGDDSRILLTDSGSGMTIEDIQTKWLNIAYSDKKLTAQQVGSYLAGNKGVGRFSCDRLGERVDLYTRSDQGRFIHLPVDWSLFELDGAIDATIQSISLTAVEVEETVACSALGIDSFPPSGTALLITKLRSHWDRPKLLALRRALEKFLDPNQLFEKKRFEVYFAVPDLRSGDSELPVPVRINGLVENQIFDRLQFNTTYVESLVDSVAGTVETALYHDGEAVYRITESSELYPLVRKARVVVYYLSQYKKAYFKRQMGMRLIDFGSVFLFLNGFRVSPYGDRGDDWLKLDNQKGQAFGRNLGTREVVGRVEIQDDGREHFIPISSREGLKNTDAFMQLKEEFVRDVIARLERFVVDGINWDSVPAAVKRQLATEPDLDWANTVERLDESWEKKQQRIGPSMLNLIGVRSRKIERIWFNSTLLEGLAQSREEEVTKLLTKIDGFPSDQIDHGLKLGLHRVRELLEAKQREAEAASVAAVELAVKVDQSATQLQKLEAENETYQAQTLFLKSITSQQVKDLLSYHHQINLDSETIDNCLTRAITLLSSGRSNDEALKWLGRASKANRRISVVAQFATKANFVGASRKAPTDIPAYFEQYLTTIAGSFSGAGLELRVKNDIHELFELKVSRIELSIVIDNLITNAKKANAKSFDTQILMVGPNTLRITMSDDGDGLSSAIGEVESIFDFGVTTTSGSGLGLFHAREIIQSLGGHITAAHNSPRGMKFIVELTK